MQLCAPEHCIKLVPLDSSGIIRIQTLKTLLDCALIDVGSAQSFEKHSHLAPFEALAVISIEQIEEFADFRASEFLELFLVHIAILFVGQYLFSVGAGATIGSKS